MGFKWVKNRIWRGLGASRGAGFGEIGETWLTGITVPESCRQRLCPRLAIPDLRGVCDLSADGALSRATWRETKTENQYHSKQKKN
eukprot:3201347-Amphidinium_carterae.1